MPVYRGRRPKTWRVTHYSAGRQREEIVRGTRRQALAREAELRLLAPRRTAIRAGLTLAELSSGPYAQHGRIHLEPSTWRTREFQLAAICTRMGDLPIDALSVRHFELYQAQRAAEVKASTVNNEVRVALTALRWAASAGYRVSVPKVRRLKQAAPRARAFTLEELRRLYDSTAKTCPHLLPLFLAMANTGLRPGEAIRADWSWVDWPGAVLRIPVLPDWKPKNGKPREVPLNSLVRRVLAGRKRAGPLFPRLDGGRFRTFPKDLWWRASRAAGLSGGPHQLRHTYASHFLASVPDMFALSVVMGHSHSRTTELYAHLLPHHLERARKAVELAPSPKTLAAALAAKQV